MAYGTINADVIGTSVANTSLGAGNASIMKNRIINGAMVIDQRNAGASVTVNSGTNLFIADRWFANGESADGVFTGQQITTAPTGFNNSLKFTVTTADASIGATQGYTFRQRIEGYNFADLGWGTASAKTITISFWVQSSVTGTFGGSLFNGNGDRVYPFSFSISSANTWEQKSVTIAGDTTGTWSTTNGTALNLVFSLGVGSTYKGTAGSWGSTFYFAPTGSVNLISTLNATFYITGVQLEVGSSATGYEYRQYGQELALCQRYYETISVAADETFVLQCISTSAARGGWQYKVSKRATPTNSSSGTVTLCNATASANTAANIGFNTGSIDVAAVSATGSGSLVAGNATNMGGSTGKLIASAEL